MKQYILLVILLISICGHSQTTEDRTKDRELIRDLIMTEYEKDKDAEALVLSDVGDYYFQGDYTDGGFLLHMKRKIRMKILKQAGLEYANFEIPFYIEGQDWEKIEELKGATYNYEDGKVNQTILTSKNIFEEKINDNVRLKKIAFADVREGSVIELSYTLVTPYFFNIREWQFQKKIPVAYSCLNYKAIPYFEYTYLLKGTNKLDDFKEEEHTEDIRFRQLLYREKEYSFVMKDVPAFKDEEYITSEKDYMIALNFQLSRFNYPNGGSKEIISTWPAMCEDFLKDEKFGKYIRSSEKEAKKILPSLDLEGKEPSKQIEIITNYVKKNYNWNGFLGKYVSENLSGFLKQKTGNIANLNLFLIGLLKTAGIEVYPIVLSTRSNGAVSRSHPFQHFFNYVIVQVVIDGKPIYIDASEPLLYYNDLPARCINVTGLVVRPKAEEWVFVPQKGISISQKEFKLKIEPDKKGAHVDARFVGSGFNAYNYRRVYMGKNENLVKFLKDVNNIDAIGDIQVTESGSLSRPIFFTFSFNTPVEGSSDKLFIHPFCNISIKDNPFKQTKRNLLIDMIYVRGEIYNSVIEIPEGYKAEHIPEPYTLNNDVVKVDYAIQSGDTTIEIIASYTLKKNIYDAEEYESLKMSFAEIIKRFSDMVVLVKE